MLDRTRRIASALVSVRPPDPVIGSRWGWFSFAVCLAKSARYSPSSCADDDSCIGLGAPSTDIAAHVCAVSAANVTPGNSSQSRFKSTMALDSSSPVPCLIISATC